MRALDEKRIELKADVVRHIDLCLGCRACEVACPSGVQYGALLEATRDHIEKKHNRTSWQTFLRRVLIEKIFPFPNRLALALLPARLARLSGFQKYLPLFARDALDLVPTAVKSIPLPRVVPIPPTVAPKGRVGFVSGCVMPVMFSGTNVASASLLAESGYEVITPEKQVCCGALYAHSGQLEKARECARKNIDAFSQHPMDAIIINAAGCGSTLKEYGHLLEHDSVYAKKAASFSAKVKDLSEWIKPEQFAVSEKPQHLKVTYHDACHLAHAQRITQPPRRLIQALAGPNYVELPEADVCCGSAGTYNLTEPGMAERLQKRKIANIMESGARIVVTTNPGCLLQIQTGLRKAKAKHVRAMHIADFLLEYPGLQTSQKAPDVRPPVIA
jgi:glycolate oxidase iron-sulfur subunit